MRSFKCHRPSKHDLICCLTCFEKDGCRKHIQQAAICVFGLVLKNKTSPGYLRTKKEVDNALEEMINDGILHFKKSDIINMERKLFGYESTLEKTLQQLIQMGVKAF